MIGGKWLSLSRLKRAIKTVGLDIWRRLSSIVRRSRSTRRQPSFHRPRSLTNCTIEDNVASPDTGASTVRLGRSVSDGWDDIDRRADIFIDNFHRRIQFEREASLKFRQAERERAERNPWE